VINVLVCSGPSHIPPIQHKVEILALPPQPQSQAVTPSLFPLVIDALSSVSGYNNILMETGRQHGRCSKLNSKKYRKSRDRSKRIAKASKKKNRS
jgi:heme exporter protein D